MSNHRNYQAALAHLEQDLTGFVGASFIDIDSGSTLAAHSVRPEFELGTLGVAGREMVKLQHEAIRSFGSDAALGELVVTWSSLLQVCQLISPGLLLFVVVEYSDSELLVMRSTSIRATIERRVENLRDGSGQGRPDP